MSARGGAPIDALGATLFPDAGEQPTPGDATAAQRLPEAGLESTSTADGPRGAGEQGRDAGRGRGPSVKADSLIQHYEIIRPLGQGGMGAVFLARDTRLGRLVALKLLSKHSGERAQRFLIEARATAQISHENIVVLHDLGEHLGTPYMVLEYLKGKTLQQMLRERQQRSEDEPKEDGEAEAAAPADAGLPPNLAIELMIPVVRALVCAHARGIVHRDLKPSNIMLGDAGTVKVLDFGLAKLLGEPEDLLVEDARGLSLTTSGAQIGTVPYMSPEQWGAGPVDERTDLWAVGILLAELVLGRHPLWPLSLFKLATVGSLEVPMPSLRELRPDLGKLGSIIDRCLIKQREDRLGSAGALLGELEALLSAPRRPASADEEQNPFVGLSAFQESDAGRFFGRARAVMEVVSRLADQPLLAIVGPSGVGKSSFMRAGVIPALDRTGDAWQAFSIRPGPHPMAALAELLFADAFQTSRQSGAPPRRKQAAPVAEDREGLITRLHAEPGFLGAQMRAGARRKLKRVLLFVDQFEEIYTLAPDKERAAFFACLAGVADDAGSPLRVVLALRSDFLDRVAEADAAMTGLDRGIMPLSPLDREGLRDALLRPLAAVDHRFEHPALVEEMLGSLEHTAGALPLLSFTAARLWEQRDRARRVLTEASYRRIGGVAGTLAGHADAVLGAMSPDERKLARAALLRLITPERTRALCTRGELCALTAAPLAMERVLGRLVGARLLTVEGGGEAEATVELVHESLIASWPTLAGWVAENQEDAVFLSRLRHAAREWQASGQSEDLLWRGQAAEGAKRWQAGYPGELAPREERYLEAVVGLAERARRLRLRAAMGAIAALTTIAFVVSYLAFRADREAARARAEAARAEQQATRAEQQATRADQEAARAQAEAVQARNATRMAAARELQADPTAMLALMREIEPLEVPRGWSELARGALQGGLAHVVFTHPDKVTSAAFSPDGKRLATASQDKTVRVWSADGSGEPLTLYGHQDAVYSVAWSPDGQRLVTASLDKTVRVWSADGSGEPLTLYGHQDGVNSAAFSPDGKRLVTASGDKTVRVWNADGTGEPKVLRGHQDWVASAAFSPDGKHLVTASRDKTARVWNADGTGASWVLRGHQDVVSSAAFSPDSKHLVTASRDKTVRVWSADGTSAPKVLRGHQQEVYSAAWSPDGKRLVTASFDKTVRVWSADGADEPKVLHGHQDVVYAAAWSPDGKRLITASFDRTARMWNADGTGELLVLRGHQQEVFSTAWSPDGTRLVSASLDRTARVWNADGSGEPQVLRGHQDWVYSVAWSPDSKRLVTASRDKTVRVWSADGTGEPKVLRGHQDWVLSAAFSPDGKRLVSASQDRTVRVWSADGTGEPRVLRGHQGEVFSAAFSPDGKRLVTASQDKTVRVWNADGTGEPLVLRGHEDRVYSAAWSPDGERLITASWDRTARVWNADGTGEPKVLRGHQDWVLSAAFSPDGKHLVTASQDRTVRVWNADGTGEPLVLRGAEKAYNAAAFSPDGKSIVAASDDKTVWVWTDLEPLHGPGDPKLWTATTYCMPIERRIELLHLPEATARAEQQACLRRVEEARAAAPAPR